MATYEDNKAKIYISCGQSRSRPHELQIAADLSKELRLLGFHPYVAVQTQSLDSLKSNIFREIESSEYFLFIDFYRPNRFEAEENLYSALSLFREIRRFIPSAKRPRYLGSLFCHQELAIASFLNKEIIAFEEAGIRSRDGMASCLQLNSHQFSDYKDLVNRVISEVKIRWSSTWKDTLKLRIPRPPFSDASDGVGNNNRYFHIEVENLNPQKSVHFCSVLPISAINSETKQSLLSGSAELKWAGVHFPQVAIRPAASRKVDVFYLPHSSPTIGRLGTLTDSSEFWNVIRGPGKFLIEFEMISSNFHSVRFKTEITLGSTVAEAGVRLL